MKVRYRREAPGCYVEAWVSYGGQRAPRVNTTDENLKVVLAREPGRRGQYCYVSFRRGARHWPDDAELRRRAKAGPEEFIDARIVVSLLRAAAPPSQDVAPAPKEG